MEAGKSCSANCMITVLKCVRLVEQHQQTCCLSWQISMQIGRELQPQQSSTHKLSMTYCQLSLLTLTRKFEHHVFFLLFVIHSEDWGNVADPSFSFLILCVDHKIGYTWCQAVPSSKKIPRHATDTMDAKGFNPKSYEIKSQLTNITRPSSNPRKQNQLIQNSKQIH